MTSITNHQDDHTSADPLFLQNENDLDQNPRFHPISTIHCSKSSKIKILSIVEEILKVIDSWTFETRIHAYRSTTLSLQIGTHMGLNPSDLFWLGIGSLLHDLGKLEVPREILIKPSSLRPEEWAMMRRHPELGGKILERLPVLLFAKPLVVQHQERWNGSGYPLGLKEKEVCLHARIFMVADSFDSMTSKRSFSKMKSFDEACSDILSHSGILYDPNVIYHFYQVIEKHKNDYQLLIDMKVYSAEKFTKWFMEQCVDSDQLFGFD